MQYSDGILILVVMLTLSDSSYSTTTVYDVSTPQLNTFCEVLSNLSQRNVSSDNNASVEVVHVLGDGILQLNEMCVVTFFGVHPPNVFRIQCTSTSRFQCSASDPCFHFNTSSTAVSVISIEIIGCSFVGGGVRVDSTSLSLVVSSSVFSGKGLQPLIETSSAQNVTIQSTNVTDGGGRLATVGGCVSIKGVKGFVFFDSVTVSNCASLSHAGCVCITGDNTTGFKDLKGLPADFFGTDVVIRNSLFEKGKTLTRGGVLAVRFMRSLVVEDTTIQHGRAAGEGCLQAVNIGPGDVVFRRVTIRNCTGDPGNNGCGNISPHNGTNMILEDINLMDCVTAADYGFQVGNTDNLIVRRIRTYNTTCGGKCSALVVGVVGKTNVIEDIHIERSMSQSASLCLFDLNNVILQNVGFNDVTATGNESMFRIVNSTNVALQNIVATKATALRQPCGFSMVSGNENISLNNVRLSCAILGVSRYFSTTKETLFVPRMQYGFTEMNLTSLHFTTTTTTKRERNIPIMNTTSSPAGRVARRDIITSVVSSMVVIVELISVSGDGVVMTSLVGTVLFDCNQYTSSILEDTVSRGFRDNNPRILNLQCNLIIMGFVLVVDGVVALIIVSFTDHQYSDLIHPAISFRVFLVFFCDFVAGAMNTLTSADRSALEYALSVCVLMYVAIVLFYVNWKYLRHCEFAGINLQYYTPNIHDANQTNSTTFCDALWNVGGMWHHLSSVDGQEKKEKEMFQGFVRKGGVFFDVFIPSGVLRGVWCAWFLCIAQGVLSGVSISHENNGCVHLYWVTMLVYLGTLCWVLRTPRLHHTLRDRVSFCVTLTTLIVCNGLHLMEHLALGRDTFKTTIATLVIVEITFRVVCGSLSAYGALQFEKALGPLLVTRDKDTEMDQHFLSPDTNIPRAEASIEI